MPNGANKTKETISSVLNSKSKLTNCQGKHRERGNSKNDMKIFTVYFLKHSHTVCFQIIHSKMYILLNQYQNFVFTLCFKL